MSYIMQSPWTDAAEYGRGLGDRLAEALIQLPAIRAKMAQRLDEQHQRIAQQIWERQMREKEFGLRKEEVKATEGLRQETFKQRGEFEQQRLGIESQRLGLSEKAEVDRMADREATRKAQQFRQDKSIDARTKINQSRLTAHDKDRQAQFAEQEKQIGMRGQEQEKQIGMRAGNRKLSGKEKQQQIIQGGQALFKKYKNLDMVRKYLQDNAAKTGIDVDPSLIVGGQ